MTLFDPGIDARSTKLRTEARPAERQAAKRSAGRAGSWRRRIFNLVRASGFDGATSKEIAFELGRQSPCEHCACVHRPPIPVNQIASRLQELREWGYLRHDMFEGTPLTRGGAEVHVVTWKGQQE
jgi:hypothetical protein